MSQIALFKEEVIPLLREAGYVCIFMEFKGRTRRVLEITIEREDGTGVSIKDCVGATRLVQHKLEKNDPFGFDFSIEVNSPGPHRPLMGREDFERFKEERVKLVLKEEFFGQKVYEGVLKGLKENNIILERDLCLKKVPSLSEWPVLIPCDFIKTASLEPLSQKKQFERTVSKKGVPKGPSRLTKVKER